MDSRFYTVVQVWDGIKMVHKGRDQNKVLEWVSKHYGDPPSEKRAKLRIRGIVVSKAEEEEKARLLAEKRRIPGSRSAVHSRTDVSNKPATGTLPPIFQQKKSSGKDVNAAQARKKTGRMQLSDLDTLDGNAEAEEGLRLAAAKNDVNVIKQLLRGKVNPNTQGKRGWTALHKAVFADRTLAASVLLAHAKTDPNTTSQEGNTALHWCALRDNPTIAGIILTHPKTDINQRNKVGFTALHIAASRNCAPLYKLLVECDADVLLKNKELETAEDVAHRSDAQAVLDVADRMRRIAEFERRMSRFQT